MKILNCSEDQATLFGFSFLVKKWGTLGGEIGAADTAQEMLELIKENHQIWWGFDEQFTACKESVRLGESLKISVPITGGRWGTEYKIFEIRCQPQPIMQVEADFYIHEQTGTPGYFLGEEKLIEVQTSAFDCTLGADDAEIHYRMRLHHKVLIERWEENHRQKYLIPLKKMAQEWVDSHQGCDPRIKQIVMMPRSSYPSRPAEFWIDIMFDVGGEHSLEKFVSYNDSYRRGGGTGMHSGYVATTHPNPFAIITEEKGIEGCEKVLNEIISGQWDDFIKSLPKLKKVIPNPSRLNKI